MTAYYNENDAAAAAWLRELIRRGLIAPGDVDERSVEDVQADDLRRYTQCHFFAGICGWSHALRLAGWPDDRPVWTGSCPCQPFSVAGRRAGTDDHRHLWPEFARLIGECAPAVVFGEQVASPGGREWLAGVRADLESMGYAVGAADLCAASVGAPHIRQRLYWVADSGSERYNRQSVHLQPRRPQSLGAEAAGRGQTGGVGNAHQQGPQGWGDGPDEYACKRAAWATSLDNWIPCADGKARRIEPGIEPLAHGIPARVVRLRGYGNAIVPQVAAAFIEASLGWVA